MEEDVKVEGEVVKPVTEGGEVDPGTEGGEMPDGGAPVEEVTPEA